MLKLFNPDYLKVASRDLTNLPLLKALAETNIPMILSTGMADQTALDNALNVISNTTKIYRYYTVFLSIQLIIKTLI